MMAVPNIYLIGLGGIGGAYASMAQDHGFELKIICSEARKTRYSQDGFLINNRPYDFQYHTQPQETVDLLLIAVKANQLLEAIEEIRPFVSEQTIIISLLNGISSEQIIAQQLPKGKILHGFTVKTDGQRKGNIIFFTPGGQIVFGHLNPEDQEIADRAAQYLEQAGVPFLKVEDILFRQWWKMMVNVGINQTQALLRGPYAIFQKKHARTIARLAMKEAIEVANKLEVPLQESHLDEVFEMVNAFTPGNKTSMLQDIEAQRPTEVDIFSGEIMRLGEKWGVDTPVNSLLFHTIRHFEEQF